MQADFTLSRDQFIAANYQLSARPRRMASAIAATFLLILGAIFANGLPLPAAIAFFVVIIAAGVIVLFLAGPQTVRRRYGKVYDRIESLHLPVHCTFDPEGLTMETRKGRLRLDFAKLHKIVETKGFVFLYTTPTTAQLLPKAALGEEARRLLGKAPVAR